MYKTTVLVFLITIVALSATQSCSKDKTKLPEPNICNNPSYTYLADVKPIYDFYCASLPCHSSAAQASSVDLSDYTNAKLHTELGNALCAMKHTCWEMPKDEPKLSDSLIQIVECWAANGFQN